MVTGTNIKFLKTILRLRVMICAIGVKLLKSQINLLSDDAVQLLYGLNRPLGVEGERSVMGGFYI